MAINLGDINFGLGADTTRLKSAITDMYALGRAVNAAARSQKEGSDKTEAALRRQEKAITSALQTTLRLNEAVRRVGASDSLIQTTTATFNRLTKELSNGKVTALQFQRSMEDFQASTGRVSRTVTQFASAQREAERAQKASAQAAREAARVQAAQQKAAEATARAEEKAARDRINYLAKVERALFQAEQAVNKYNNAASRVKAPAAISGAGNSALGGLRSALSGPQLPGIDFQRQAQAFQDAMNRNKAALSDFAKEQPNVTRLGLALDRVAASAVLISGPMSGLATRLSIISGLADKVSISTAALVTGLSAGTYAFIQLGKGAIESSRQLDKVREGLMAVTGGAIPTAATIDYLTVTADKLGLQFTQTAQDFTKLAASAKGTSLEGENTRVIFENIAAVGAKLGLSVDDVSGTLRALGQIMSKGTVQSEELRGQLGDRLPGAFQAFADSMGVSTEKLGEMMKKGEVTSTTLVGFAKQLAHVYGVDLSKAVDTVTARENRATNAWERFNRAVDQSIGYTNAYKGILQGLTGVFDFLANNINGIISTVGAAAGAIAGAMAVIYAPAVITGISTLIVSLRGIATALAAVNIAALANPLGGLISLFVKLAAVVGGAAAGFFALKQSTDGTGEAHQEATKGIAAFIKSQKDAQTQVRLTTQEYIKQQEVILVSQQQAITAELSKIAQQEKSLRDMEKSIANTNGFFGAEGFGAAGDPTVDLRTSIDKAKGSLKGLQDEMLNSERSLLELNNILNKPTKSPGGGDNDDSTTGQVNRMALAIKKAKDTIRETQQEYDILMKPRGQQEWLQKQLEVNRKIEDFRDQLTKAKVPQAEVIALTEQYAASLTKVTEKQYGLEKFPDIFEEMNKILGEGFNQSINSLVDAVIDGKDVLESLADTGKAVAKDLLNTFLQLSIANPLKNMMFNTNAPTMSMGGSSGSGGLGGFFSGIGNFISGLFGARAKGGPVTAGSPYIVGENGPELFKPYGSGTIIPNNELDAFNGTASRSYSAGMGISGPVVNVTVIEAPNTQAQISQQENSSGGTDITVLLKRLDDGIADRIASGQSSTGRMIERKYRLQPTLGK